MAIQIADQFSYSGVKPLDARLQYSTVANMKAAAEASLYNGCMAYVTENKKYYVFDSRNASDSTTGRWREQTSADPNAYVTTDSTETAIDDADYFPYYDTSASGKKKTLWSNIKNVLANTFQPKLTAGQSIEITNQNVINAQMPVMSTFSKADLYDTTEKIIGKWIDGRPLYQRSFTGTTSNSADNTLVSTITNARFVDGKGVVSFDSNSNATNCVIGLSYRDSDGAESTLYSEANSLYIHTQSSQRNKYYMVTVQYYKTSDAANSYNLSSENDYSTSEKVIGTWIDGSTLYQRTYTGTIPSSGSDVVLFSVSGMYIKDATGFCLWKSGSSNYYKLPSRSVYNGNITDCGLYVYNNNMQLYVQDQNSYIYGKSYYITVKYTK